MSKNLFKRIISSIILLTLLLVINFSHDIIFILSIMIVGGFVCIEANNIFSKLASLNHLDHDKYTFLPRKFNYKFFILNSAVFFYIFFIFCQYSYEIHRIESPIFFLYIICICIFTDIGGYVFGKTIGGMKLTRISPNKTISGSIGSFASSIIPLFLFSAFGFLELTFNINNVLFCLLISLISQLGDLFISYLKRKAKIKDTGKILPGHGGVLDRVDGIIFAVPFSYFFINYLS